MLQKTLYWRNAFVIQGTEDSSSNLVTIRALKDAKSIKVIYKLRLHTEYGFQNATTYNIKAT